MSITKNLLLAGFLTCLAGAITLPAATIYQDCGTSVFIGGSGSSQINTCAGMAALPVGDVLTSIEVYMQSDYLNGGSQVTDTVGTTQNSGANFASQPLSCTVTGGNSSTSGPCTTFTPWAVPNGGASGYGPSGTGPTQTFATATSNLATLYSAGWTNTTTSTITSGTVSDSDVHTYAEYDYTVPSTGTPEPTTLAMIGSALIGLGMIGRKRLSR